MVLVTEIILEPFEDVDIEALPKDSDFLTKNKQATKAIFESGI